MLRSFWSQRRAEIILYTKPVAKLPIWRLVHEGHVSNKLLCSYYLHEVSAFSRLAEMLKLLISFKSKGVPLMDLLTSAEPLFPLHPLSQLSLASA